MARLPYSLKVLLENLLRNEDGESVTKETIESVAKWVASDEPSHRDRLLAQPRADAGLHRRAGHRGPGRHARRHGGARRRPHQDQPAGAGRAGHRPLDPGGLVRREDRVQEERRAGVRAQPGALRVPALGPDGVRQLLRGAAQHRHLPPGEPGVPVAGGHRARRPGVPRHPGGHRLAHHDGQRPGRAGLGRGRHRGRGGDAGPARVDAAAPGGRASAWTASCPRAPPPPTWCSP